MEKVTPVQSSSKVWLDPGPSDFVCVFTTLDYSTIFFSAKSVHSAQSNNQLKLQKCQGWGREFELSSLVPIDA